MRFVKGIALPDSDTHFAAHLESGPLVGGKGTYQLGKLEAAVGLCPPGRRRLAVDAGAHVGLWSRVLAGHFMRVIAFEPVHEHIDCFRVNMAECGNVVLNGFALVAQRLPEGIDGLKLTMAGGGVNSGNAHVDYGVGGRFKVPARALDEFNLEMVDLLKIDVEGYEAFVIAGATETIERCRPVIVVEQKPGNAERYGVKQFQALDMLKDMGARVRHEMSGDYILDFP